MTKQDTRQKLKEYAEKIDAAKLELDEIYQIAKDLEEEVGFNLIERYELLKQAIDELKAKMRNIAELEGVEENVSFSLAKARVTLTYSRSIDLNALVADHPAILNDPDINRRIEREVKYKLASSTDKDAFETLLIAKRIEPEPYIKPNYKVFIRDIHKGGKR